MEKVDTQPCEEFIAWWKGGAACDERLADQLVLPLALSPSESRWSAPVVTEHLGTVLWLVEKFLPIRAELVDLVGGSATVAIHGAPRES